MSDYSDVLERCPLFEGVDRQDLEDMLKCIQAREITAEKGELVFYMNDPAEYVGILLEGKAQVQRDSYDGVRTIQALFQPGDMFGETFACAGVRRLPVSVEAIEKSRVMLIRLNSIIETCPSACGFHNRVVKNLMRVLAAKNLMLNQKLEITSHRTIREKLMAYLNAQVRKAGRNSFTIPFDRQGLADYLGVDRSALSAEISKLRREGIIENERSAFILRQQ